MPKPPSYEEAIGNASLCLKNGMKELRDEGDFETANAWDTLARSWLKLAQETRNGDKKMWRDFNLAKKELESSQESST